MLKKVFNGKVIAAIPFTQKETIFQLDGNGVFSIWQEGQLFRKTPVDKFKLTLIQQATGSEVALNPSLFRPNINGWKRGRIEMKRFEAENGTYKLLITEGSSISKFEKAVSSLFPAKEVDYNEYFIQIRESQPVYYMVFSIPLFIISGFFIIGGFVLGLLAPQLLA